jgi:GR25 family glycosyltransferase involved in LPS biosynthesis
MEEKESDDINIILNNLKCENSRLRQENNRLKKQNIQQNMQMVILRDDINNAKNSNVMKVAKIYYKIRDALLPYGSRRRNVVKAIFSCVIQKILKRSDSYLTVTNNRKISDFNISYCENVGILTTQHCRFIAELIQENLKLVGISSCIIYEEPEDGFGIDPYFVICPQMFKKLPSLYIAFQMEQSVSNRWFTDRYIAVLKQAVAIFDYSTVNILFLRNLKIPYNNIFYMPVDVGKCSHQKCNKEYDVLFYGDDHCVRRHNILMQLQQKFRVKIINNLFGDQLINELSKAKIILNVHYYDNALLETPRIFECLSKLDCVIISEKSADSDEHKDLNNLVEFVDVNDTQNMIKKISYYLDTNNWKRKILENNEIIKTKKNTFRYYFMRFLLASNNISFDDFYKFAGQDVEIEGNKWCLTLPETMERTKQFSENALDFKFFPGLRHELGWIGCGLSYKFMLRKAKDMNLDNVIICEDDVLLKESFLKRFNNVMEYLNHNKNKWDVFSGLLADISPKMEIKNIDNFNFENFIFVNKMISMVFNVYNASFFEQLEDWDYLNYDSLNNTIDRYLEKKTSLKIVTTNPYLVTCKENINSTLWGGGNIIYNNMIANSEKKLENLKNQWIEKNKDNSEK